MFQIYIQDVVFAQAAKYVIIASNAHQTKRTQVCSLYTSVPTFQDPISIDQLASLTIKACVATIDRKLTIIGSFILPTSEFNMDSEIIFKKSCQFNQEIQGKIVCAGRCQLLIQKKQPQGIKNQEKGVEDEEDFELKSDGEQQAQDQNCSLRFIFHCGFGFYLNSGFKIQIKWQKQVEQTQIIKDRISPIWNQVLPLLGQQSKELEISIIDKKNNKLEWLRILPQKIRIMFPYHLKLIFREQYVGSYPSIYLTIIREDIPKFSVLERQMKLKIKQISSQTKRISQYLFLYPKSLEQEDEPKLPLFIELNMNNYINFNQVNKLIEKTQTYEWYNWNLVIPISKTKIEQAVILLKSILMKPLICLYCCYDDAKALFEKRILTNVKILDQKEPFQNYLKKLYYEQEKIVFGKSIEISNLELASIDNENQAISEEQKWKILSQNYLLRTQMISKSLSNIQQVKKMIKQKGEVLVGLKKNLAEVKKINSIMVEKEKSAFVAIKQKKPKKIIDSVSKMQIIATLYEKQAELDRRKKVNDEMRMRMDTLEYFGDDTQKLDEEVVANAKKLLQQQQKKKKMEKIKESIPKQLELIGKLQKIFQKRQIDRQLNELLQQQSMKLQRIKRDKRKNLQNIYTVVKEHSLKQKSLPQQVKQAEDELQKLNLMYARLTT